MNPMDFLQGLMPSGRTQCNTNAFEVITQRLLQTIDQFQIFNRVDDVMRVNDPLAGMKEIVKAQVEATKGGEGEDWKETDQEDNREEGFIDKGRMHITLQNSLKPILSLFTCYTYVSPTKAAEKAELGLWSVTLTFRDKRLIEQYGGEFRSYTGNIFNEIMFAKMLDEITNILQYIIELDKLNLPPNDNIIDMSKLDYSQQLTIRQILTPPQI